MRKATRNAKSPSAISGAVGTVGCNNNISDDIMSKLTPMQLAFVQHVAAERSQVDAYALAGYSVAGHDSKYIANRASNLATSPKVAAAIRQMRRETGKIAAWTRADMVDMLHNIAAEAYAQSHPVVADDVAEDGTVQQVTLRKYDAQAAAVALKAVEQAARMCGFNEPDKVDNNITITIAGDDNGDLSG